MTAHLAQLRFLGLVGATWFAMFALSLRFEDPEFRPWERLASEGATHFHPGQKLTMTELGDLEAWSWVRALQTPSATTFSTDRFGLRNPEGIAAPRVVVIGDSYVAGSGLPDTGTLTARMAAKLGEPIYNYAFSSHRMPAQFLADARFAAQPPEVVVYAPNQRNLSPALLSPHRSPAASSLSDFVQQRHERLELSNGLTRAARYAYNGAHFELFGHEKLVWLPDRTPVLVLSVEHQRLHAHAPGRHERVVAAVAELGRVLAQRGIHLVFAPIPDVGNIYPELYPEAQRAAIVEPSMIDAVVARSRAGGLMVADLPGLFRANKWPYLYRRDDSHWNERGVELTAEVLSSAVHALRTAPAPRSQRSPGSSGD